MKFKLGAEYCLSNDKEKWHKCYQCGSKSKTLYQSKDNNYYCGKCKEALINK